MKADKCLCQKLCLLWPFGCLSGFCGVEFPKCDGRTHKIRGYQNCVGSITTPVHMRTHFQPKLLRDMTLHKMVSLSIDVANRY